MQTLRELIQERCIFWTFGVGKSKEALDRCLAHRPHGPILVLCKTPFSWEVQCQTWLGDTWFCVRGKDGLTWEVGENGHNKVVWIMSYQYFIRHHNDPKIKQFFQHGAVVIDESRILANTKNKFYKQLLLLFKQFPGTPRFLLSGLPCPESFLELWGQFEIALYPNNPLGPFYKWRAAFFDPGYNGWTWTLKPGRLEKIRELMAGTQKTMSWDNDSYLLTYQPDAEAQKISQHLKKTWDDLVSKEEYTDSMTVLHRLRQIQSGLIHYHCLYPYYQEFNEYMTPKDLLLTDLVKDKIESKTGGMVIWYYYVEEVEKLEKILTAIPGVITARLSDEGIAAFEQEEANVMLASLHRSEGHNGLQIADMAVYYSFSWSLEKRLQADHRLTRRGQLRTVQFIDLVGENTIEMDAYTAIQNKTMSLESLLKGIEQARV